VLTDEGKEKSRNIIKSATIENKKSRIRSGNDSAVSFLTSEERTVARDESRGMLGDWSPTDAPL